MKRKLKLLTATLVAVIATTALAVAASSPAVVTGSATSVGDTAANIHGTVNPEGSATSYFFQWGVSTTYGAPTAEIDPIQTAGNKSSSQLAKFWPAAEQVFGRARLKIVGGNHLGRRQRIAYDRTQPRFANTTDLLAE